MSAKLSTMAWSSIAPATHAPVIFAGKTSAATRESGAEARAAIPSFATAGTCVRPRHMLAGGTPSCACMSLRSASGNQNFAWKGIRQNAVEDARAATYATLRPQHGPKRR